MVTTSRLGETPVEGMKSPCRVATTVNITLSGEQTIDTVSVVAGDRVLVKDQTDASENGVYVVAAGAWTRATDFNNSDDLAVGQTVTASEGANDPNWYTLSWTGTLVLDTTDLVFTLLPLTVQPLYFDGVKGPCRAATTANITLSGEQTIDSIAVVTGDRALVKDQTDASENGIYVVSSGAWVRAIDFNEADDLAKGQLVLTSDSSKPINRYSITWSGTLTFGTTDIIIALFKAESVSIQDFGGVADGVDTGSAFSGTDNLTALTNALAYACPLGLSVHIPAGTYRFGDPDAAPWQASYGANPYINLSAYDFIHIYGDGASTVLLIDEDDGNIVTGNAQRFFIDSRQEVSPYAKDTHDLFGIRDLEVKGRWTHSPGGQDTDPNGIGVVPFRAEGFNRVRFKNVGWFDLRNKGTRCAHNNSYKAIDCYGERAARGFIRTINSNDVVIIGNILKWGDDDSIDVGIESESGDNVPERVVVANNTVIDGESSLISVGVSTTITGNTFTRCKGGALSVARSGTNSGATSKHSVSIANNIINDTFERYDFTSSLLNTTDVSTGALVVYGNKRDALLTTVYPGEYDSGTLAFILPYEASTTAASNMHIADTVTEGPGMGKGYTITGNIIQRTLPTPTNYSDWGLGLMFTRQGWKDPTVSNDNRKGNGIALLFDMEDCIVANNIITGQVLAGITVWADNSDDVKTAFRNVKITDNIIRDCLKQCIYFEDPGSTVYWDIDISNNTLDLDPYHQNGRRTDPLDGTWISTASSSGTGSAIQTTNVENILVHNNRFSNCYRPITTGAGTLDGIDAYNNIQVCNPTSDSGWDAANIGIGDTEPASDAFRFMIVDGDPTSATYGDLINICSIVESSKPTTGTYVKGHFVKNSAPSNSYDKVLLGWVRLVTGSSHVLGTDWEAVYANADDNYNHLAVTSGITAFATGGQASAVQLTTDVNEISTVGTTGDSVKMPGAKAGRSIIVINNGANACDVFPSTSDNLGAGVDTAVSLAAGSNIRYVAYDTTNWETI